MDDTRIRQYDTFVVRLWRERATHRIVRAEVEHVQSGHRARKQWSEPIAAEEVDDLEATLWINERFTEHPAINPPADTN